MPNCRTGLTLSQVTASAGLFEMVQYPRRPHPLRELNVARVVFPRSTDLSWEMVQFAQRVFPHAGSPVSA